MNVHLSFDVEVWCNGWKALDAEFPAAFERYVFGTSAKGQYALPKTLEILRQHGLMGVFFVEPLFAARFGQQHLARITQMLLDAGQDVQLHLHPEWVDEIRPALLDDVSAKRQHLIHYSFEEQSRLIAYGKRALEATTQRPVTAFRSGSYACNADTYRALTHAGIGIDSSLNEIYDVSGIGMVTPASSAATIDSISSYPVTVFRDGFGRLRPAQLSACSFMELRDALLDAQASGVANFVIVSHNFEMLKPGSSEPDQIVVRRFEALCEFLAMHSDKFTVGPYGTAIRADDARPARPSVSTWATTIRHAEQAMRRLA